MGCCGITNEDPELHKLSINSDLENSLVSIKNKDKKGFGFLCKIPFTGAKPILPVLITSLDLIEKNEHEPLQKVVFILNDCSYTINIDNDRKTYIEENLYKIIMIEIKDDDNLKINSFFEFEEYNNLTNEKIFKNGSVGLIKHKNKGNGLEQVKCNIKQITENGYDIEYEYKINKNEELIGNPIVNLNNNKIIGIQKSLGKGILLLNPVTEFNENNMKKELEANNLFQKLKTVKTLKSTIHLKADNFKNEILLSYMVPKQAEIPFIKIFGEEFVKNNKDKCKLLLIDTEEENEINHELCAFLDLDVIDEVSHGKSSLWICLIPNEDLTDLSFMFDKCATLISVEGLNSINTEKVTSMKSMFNLCVMLQEVNVSKMNTAELTDVSQMFRKCAFLNYLNFSGWNTSKITTTKGMFEFCEALEEIDGLDDWDVSNLKDASFMFNYCKNLKEIRYLDNWNTRNLTTISNMFKGLESMPIPPNISKWNTENIVDMTLAFAFCSSLNYLPDISNWNTKNVEAIPLIF